MMIRSGLVLSLIVLSTSSAYAASHHHDANVINDSLVENLDCRLDKSTFLLHVRPDAFSVERQIPTQNWSSGYGLAECWSLSHAQRLFFFMGRFGEQMPEAESYLTTVSQTILGNYDSAPVVFPVSTISELVNSLTQGFVDTSGNVHDFKDDVQSYEDWRFYQPSNIDLITGTRDRSKEDNANTMQQIEVDLAQGRLPLIIMRAALTWQHALIVKRVSGTSPITLTVYDSNYPNTENHLTYDPDAREFTAPSVISTAAISEAFASQESVDPNAPVGVFVEDENVMDAIQDSLFDYYTQRCGVKNVGNNPTF